MQRIKIIFIADMKKSGEDSEAKILEMRDVSIKIKELDIVLAENEDVVQKTIMSLPNITHSSVPVGKFAPVLTQVFIFGYIRFQSIFLLLWSVSSCTNCIVHESLCLQLSSSWNVDQVITTVRCVITGHTVSGINIT